MPASRFKRPQDETRIIYQLGQVVGAVTSSDCSTRLGLGSACVCTHVQKRQNVLEQSDKNTHGREQVKYKKIGGGAWKKNKIESTSREIRNVGVQD